jgi:cell division septum initiation protein DivIVA
MKHFLHFLGVPSRPYREVTKELKTFIENEEKDEIKKLVKECERLRAHIKELEAKLANANEVPNTVVAAAIPVQDQ